MKEKFRLVCFFLLTGFIRTASQQPLQFPFVHYGTDAGVSANDVHSVVQDKQGYIWIGTETGLQRYDGSRFLNFFHDPLKSGSIPDNNVRHLLFDRNGNLWISFNNGKVGLFSTSRFEYTDIPVLTANENVFKGAKDLMEDGKGNIYFISYDRRLVYVYRARTKEFVVDRRFLQTPEGWLIWNIKEDSLTGKYWICGDSGLAVYNSGTHNLSKYRNNTEKDPLVEELGPSRYVLSIFPDSKRRLWIIQWMPDSGNPLFYLYDLTKKEFILSKYNLVSLLNGYHEPQGFLEQKDGTIWVYGLSFLIKFNEKEKKFRLVHNGYLNEYSIAFDRINNLCEDLESNIWVATDNNGLYRFNPSMQYFKNARNISRLTGKPSDGSVLSFAQDKDGSILVGSWGDGLYRYDSSLNALPLNIRGITEKNPSAIWCMSPGLDPNTLWIGCQPGFYRYDKQKKSAVYYNPAVLKNRTIRQLAEDRFGNLWIGTQSLGVIKWNHTTALSVPEQDIRVFASIPNNLITSLVSGRNGWMWIGTYSNGAYAVDTRTDEIICHFSPGSPDSIRLASDNVTSILEFDDSTVLIAAGGLHIFHTRTGKIEHIPLPYWLPPQITSMENPGDGYLWLSFSSGLCRVNLKKRIFLQFSKIDGIINDHFRPGSSCRLSNGHLLFGSTNQFVLFNPGSISINNNPPRVAITDVKVMNRSLLVDSLMNLDKMDLNYNQNSMVLEFSGLNYSDAYMIQYRMQGLEPGWKLAEKNNQAIYSYLPPGNYVFEIRSQGVEKNESPYVTRLVIKIRPPFWRTAWFAGLLIFCLIGVVYWADRQRMQKIRATESIRTRIATSLTEDLSNTLSSVNISSELAKSKIDSDPVRSREYIEQISDTSHRMVQSMNDMVWSINPENDTILQTIDRMKSFAWEIQNVYGMEVIFDIESAALDTQLDMQHRYELLSIYKEALINAARHSGGKHIQVTILYKKPRFTMSVQDDGKGFETGSAELGRGINDMRRRAAAMGAAITIRSEFNNGSTVKLEMQV